MQGCNLTLCGLNKNSFHLQKENCAPRNGFSMDGFYLQSMRLGQDLLILDIRGTVLFSKFTIL